MSSALQIRWDSFGSKSFGTRPWQVLDAEYGLREALGTVSCLGAHEAGHSECSEHCDFTARCRVYQREVVLPSIALKIEAGEIARFEAEARARELANAANPGMPDGQWRASDLIEMVTDLDAAVPTFSVKTL